VTRSYTQQDPIEIAGGLNLYGFANGDPVNFHDPFGLSADTVKFTSAEAAENLRAAVGNSEYFQWLYDIANQDTRVYVFREGDVPAPFLSGLTSIVLDNATGRMLGARITIDPGDFALDSKVNGGLQITYGSVAGHEFGHIVGTIILEALGLPGICEEQCARGFENGVRNDLGLGRRDPVTGGRSRR